MGAMGAMGGMGAIDGRRDGVLASGNPLAMAALTQPALTDGGQPTNQPGAQRPEL